MDVFTDDFAASARRLVEFLEAPFEPRPSPHDARGAAAENDGGGAWRAGVRRHREDLLNDFAAYDLGARTPTIAARHYRLFDALLARHAAPPSAKGRRQGRQVTNELRNLLCDEPRDSQLARLLDPVLELLATHPPRKTLCAAREKTESMARLIK